MIEAGQAVYFIENRGMDPVIKFGIVRGLWEERGFYHYAVDFLSIKEHRYIKGIPFDEFTNTEWRKIPKELRDKAYTIQPDVVWRLKPEERALLQTKLTLYNDGERVVIARGVNSLTTVTEVETADLQKIKINAIQDQIEGDIYSTINKSYIGNYSNSYDNKCLLITAIKGYLRGLEATEGGKGWLKADSSTMEINVAKQKQYLESIGVDTSEMDEQAIKEANTGSHVFLKGTISILDAIEDVDIFINKD